MSQIQSQLICIALIILPLLGVAVFFLREGIGSFATKPLQACYRGLSVRSTPLPGDVSFNYHTYRGLLIWFTQDEHQVSAAPEEARCLLRKLLQFNLTWGLLSYGLAFVPFLAVYNYLVQRRSITRQARSIRQS